MTSRIALFVLALALGVTAFTRPSWADDPFGFDALGTPDQYNCDATTLPPPNYACADAPRKHPAFTHYALKFHPSVGMCAVIGVTDVISSDQKFKSTLDDVRHQLEAKHAYPVDTYTH